MNKPIRCTTHFHACDCREYEFEQLRKENELLETWIKHHQTSAQNAVNEKSELMKKLDDKRVYIKQLKDKNLSLVELIEPMSRKLDEKDAEIKDHLIKTKAMIEYCEPHLEKFWASKVVGTMLGCDFRDAKDHIKEFFEFCEKEGV